MHDGSAALAPTCGAMADSAKPDTGCCELPWNHAGPHEAPWHGGSIRWMDGSPPARNVIVPLSEHIAEWELGDDGELRVTREEFIKHPKRELAAGNVFDVAD